jgi:16S rRNA (cytosine1402-N4)-methyltransferase
VDGQRPEHIPVLADALLEHLALPQGGTVVDATVGLGGHAIRVLDKLGKEGRLIGLDVDEANLNVARERLSLWADRVVLRRRNFSELRAVLNELGIPGVHAIVADLGVSSNQLLDPGRGFSFAEDGPLDMRLDDRLPTTAADLVNSLPERELADIFYFNAQERFSRRIAKRICQSRRDARIRRTAELARIVCAALGADPQSHKSKIHPATRVFLALRIVVNNEMAHLESLLEQAPECLLPPGGSTGATEERQPDEVFGGGRLAIISFHSVEDGIVKRDFRRREAAGQYRVCTKKPIPPEAEEIRRNPRARSAKLRVAQRVA